MTLEIGELCHWALHGAELLALLVIGRDLLKLAARIEAVQTEEQQVEQHVAKEEHVRHDETDQLRRDVDAVALRLQNKIDQKRSHRPRPQKETLEGAFAPPRQPDDTRVWSPNEPKLPNFADTLACGCPEAPRSDCGTFCQNNRVRRFQSLDDPRPSGSGCPACDYLNSPCPRHQ